MNRESQVKEIRPAIQYLYQFSCNICNKPFAFDPAANTIAMCQCNGTGLLSCNVHNLYKEEPNQRARPVVIYFSIRPIEVMPKGQLLNAAGKVLSEIDTAVPARDQLWTNQRTNLPYPKIQLLPPVVVTNQPLNLAYGGFAQHVGAPAVVDSYATTGTLDLINFRGALVRDSFVEVMGFKAVYDDEAMHSYTIPIRIREAVEAYHNFYKNTEVQEADDGPFLEDNTFTEQFEDPFTTF